MSNFLSKSRVVIGLIIIVMSTGCAEKVIQYVNSTANFQSFHTYTIIDPNENPYKEEITKGIAKQMQQRGYEESNIDPDLIINYVIGSSSRTEIDNNYNPYSYFQRFPTSRNLHESFLIISIFDSYKKLVWQGSSKIPKPSKKQSREESIHNFIHHIFTTYPYTAGSNDPGTR